MDVAAPPPPVAARAGRPAAWGPIGSRAGRGCANDGAGSTRAASAAVRTDAPCVPDAGIASLRLGAEPGGVPDAGSGRGADPGADIVSATRRPAAGIAGSAAAGGGSPAGGGALRGLSGRIFPVPSLPPSRFAWARKSGWSGAGSERHGTSTMSSLSTRRSGRSSGTNVTPRMRIRWARTAKKIVAPRRSAGETWGWAGSACNGLSDPAVGPGDQRAASLASMAVMSAPATSAPNAASISRMHVGLVTLISVR